MNSIFNIPGPVKFIFDQFPLKTYGPISNKDEFLTNELATRRFYFRGSNSTKSSIDDVFLLGVYNVFEETEFKDILSTDPSCLFVQLVLCQQNGLKLPKSKKNKEVDNAYSCSIGCLSYLSNKDEELPVLAEGFKKRFVRSSFLINESINTKVELNESGVSTLYMTLLDRAIYDGWIAHTIYVLQQQEFAKLYAYNSTQNIWYIKKALVGCNSFSTRHKELSNILTSNMINDSKRKNLIQDLVTPIMNHCEGTLSKFENSISENPGLFISDRQDEKVSYFQLKLTSYMTCICNLPESSTLRTFTMQNCPNLIKYSRDTLKLFSDETVNKDL